MERRLRKLKKNARSLNQLAWGLSGFLPFSFLFFFFEGRGGLLVWVIVIDSCFKNNHFLSSLVIERCAKLRV